MTIDVDLDLILQKAGDEESLSRQELAFLLGLNRQEDLAKLFERARSLREKKFGNYVYLYGDIHCSTWCRNDCTFCCYRISNNLCKHYRKTDSEIIEQVIELTSSGIHLINLMSGEDIFYLNSVVGVNPLVHIVETVNRETSIPIMVSPGVVSQAIMAGIATAGADWYSCCQDTHNRKHFNQLRANQKYDARFLSKFLAAEKGLLIEDGILAGIGESIADMLFSIDNIRYVGAHQIRVMSFVPQIGTPMDDWTMPDPMIELKMIAIMRLMFPDRLISAPLDSHGMARLMPRMNAGANVIAGIQPIVQYSPRHGAQQNMEHIAKSAGTVAGILPILAKLGLEPASHRDYQRWIDREKEKLLLERSY